MAIKTYYDLMKIKTFEDRLRYLMTGSGVGLETFGPYRYLNQVFYSSSEWKSIRRKVILRDDGYDLGHFDHRISGEIYVHHIQPVTIDDIVERRDIVFDLNNLISTSYNTHNIIHYGVRQSIPMPYVERRANDTCPWKEVLSNDQTQKSSLC